MSDPLVGELVERAFDYRGHVTVSRRDGSRLVGFVYDRGPTHIEMFDEQAAHRIRLPIGDIAEIALTGEDCAASAQGRWQRRRETLESSSTSAWGEWEEHPTLILTAMPIELRSIARVLGAKVRSASARGRFGETPALARAVGVGGGAAHAIAAVQPALVISCGFAGALDASLGGGDLVLASSVRDESSEVVTAPEGLLRVAREALARCAVGEILCATRVAATRDEKRALATPGRLAVDLESWAVARAAQRRGIPWLVIRVVLDRLEDELPAFTREIGNRHVTAALRYALGGPRSVLALARLGVRAAAATRSLESALRQLAPAVGRHGVAGACA